MVDRLGRSFGEVRAGGLTMRIVKFVKRLQKRIDSTWLASALWGHDGVRPHASAKSPARVNGYVGAMGGRA